MTLIARIIRLLRIIGTCLAAMRYMISVVVGIVVLGYGLLTELGVVPLYTILAASWHLNTPLLLLLLYLLVAALGGLIWYLWILRPQESLPSQLRLRWIYRQTDPAGQTRLNCLTLAGLALGALLAPFILGSPVLSDPAIFLAAVFALPIALDFWPGFRPRRVVVQSGQSLAGIAAQVADNPARQARALSGIWIYNELDADEPTLSGPELPQGMVIEIPPRD